MGLIRKLESTAESMAEGVAVYWTRTPDSRHWCIGLAIGDKCYVQYMTGQTRVVVSPPWEL